MFSTKKYNHSGMNNGNYGNIEAKSVFTITGMGNVTINGTIGEGATIIQTGMGNLTINGTVKENVTFKISGMGNLKFAQRPPESVLRLIKKSGMGNIEMPGGYIETEPQNNNIHSASYRNTNPINSNITSRGGVVTVTRNGICTTYRGNNLSMVNGRLIIDGREVTENDSRIISTNGNRSYRDNRERDSETSGLVPDLNNLDLSNASTFIESLFSSIPAAVGTSINRQDEASSVMPQLSPPSQVKNKTATSANSVPYTNHLVNYLDSFENYKKLSDQIKDLKLTAEEIILFEKFVDPITFDYMNRPVTLNEVHHDFDTLRTLKEDPFTREKFSPLEIQSARRLVEELKGTIAKVENNRKQANAASSAASVVNVSFFQKASIDDSALSNNSLALR